MPVLRGLREVAANEVKAAIRDVIERSLPFLLRGQWAAVESASLAEKLQVRPRPCDISQKDCVNLDLRNTYPGH